MQADEPEVLKAKVEAALREVVNVLLPLPPLMAVAILADVTGRIVQNYGKTAESRQEMMATVGRFMEMGRSIAWTPEGGPVEYRG